jgi:hypothetical protein
MENYRQSPNNRRRDDYRPKRDDTRDKRYNQGGHRNDHYPYRYEERQKDDRRNDKSFGDYDRSKDPYGYGDSRENPSRDPHGYGNSRDNPRRDYDRGYRPEDIGRRPEYRGERYDKNNDHEMRNKGNDHHGNRDRYRDPIMRKPTHDSIDRSSERTESKEQRDETPGGWNLPDKPLSPQPEIKPQPQAAKPQPTKPQSTKPQEPTKPSKPSKFQSLTPELDKEVRFQ